MTEQVLNIRQLTNSLCVKIGFEPRQVAKIVITPTQLIADIYELNDYGSKFVRETGEAAKTTHAFNVTT